MTDIVEPPAVIVPPQFPELGNPNFNNLAFAWGTALPGVSMRLGVIAQVAYQDAVAANERATLAGLAAASASESANAASQDAARLAALNALYLGPLPADPDSGRGGAPLVPGNFYINTATGAVRAYTGVGWVQGVGAVAGVNSINGEAGALVKTTLSAYGITDIATGAKGAIDLDGLITPGLYTFAAAPTAPAGVAGGVVYVARAAGVLGQIAVDASGSTFSRGATGIGGAPVFSPWRRVALQNDVPVAIAGGIMDCSAGNRFTATVGANTTLSFSNVPGGAYACVLEVNHTAGTLTLPAGVAWSNGVTPTLTAGKRHLLYFEKCLLGTPGWYVSALSNFGA